MVQNGEGENEQEGLPNFDSQDFDVIGVINKMFPTEGSLKDLPQTLSLLKKKIESVDREILGAVRQQSSCESRARQDLALVKEQIRTLSVKIVDIKMKSEQTQAQVESITKNIKKFDTCKNNLTVSITGIKKFSMMAQAVGQLEKIKDQRDDYREAGLLLDAVSQLAGSLEDYLHLDWMQKLLEKVSCIQTTLTAAVNDDFKQMWSNHDPRIEGMSSAQEDVIWKQYEPKWARLKDACTVVNSLGVTVRDNLLSGICLREIDLFRQIKPFEMPEHQTLKSMENKYLWFVERLKNEFLARQRSVFPESWKAAQLMAATFCKECKSQLGQILDKKVSSSGFELKELLETVARTREFERALNRELLKSMEIRDDGQEMTWSDTLSASEMRRIEDKKRVEEAKKRLQSLINKEEQEQQKSEENKEGLESSSGPNAGASISNFEGLISAVFESYLTPYINEERRELMKNMQQFVTQEGTNGWMPVEGGVHHILESANELMKKIKTISDRCKQVVSNGEAFLNLSRMFVEVLKAYGDELLKRLPKTKAGATTARPPFSGEDWWVVFSDNDGGKELAVVCRIIQTAEFCSDRVNQLQDYFEKATKAPYNTEVDLSDADDHFSSVAAAGLSILILGFNTRADKLLVEMAGIKWGAMGEVGDQSPYVNQFRGLLQEWGGVLKDNLRKEITEVDTYEEETAYDDSNLTYFMDKSVRMFLPRFYENIFKIKKITDVGGRQLLLDIQALRTLLLRFPSFSGQQEVDPTYEEFVKREISNSEALAKVLSSHLDTIIDLYCELMPERYRNHLDFQRVIDLKTSLVNKQEVQNLVQAFQKRVSLGGVSSSAGMGQVESQLPATVPQQATQRQALLSNLGARAGIFRPNIKGVARSGLNRLASVPPGEGDKPLGKSGGSGGFPRIWGRSTQNQEQQQQ